MPARTASFCWLTLVSCYNFIFLIPDIVRNAPRTIELFINYLLSVILITLSDFGVYLSEALDYFISGFLRFWLYNTYVVKEWFELLFINPFVYFFSKLYNPIFDFLNNYRWQRTYDRYVLWHSYNIDLYAFKWKRNPERYRPEEHWAWLGVEDFKDLWKRYLGYNQYDSGYMFWITIEEYSFYLKVLVDRWSFYNPFEYYRVKNYEDFKICLEHHLEYYFENILYYQLHYLVELALLEINTHGRHMY